MAIHEVYLQPGQFWFGGGQTRVRTLLGSCVAIVLWHPQQLIGGMCHFLLSDRRRVTAAPDLPGRYADEAVSLFMREVTKAKTTPAQYQVKLFGGGRMFRSLRGQDSEIGARNILAARHELSRAGFAVHREHVGDNGHRHIIFDLPSGDVWVKHVQEQAPTEISAAQPIPELAACMIEWQDTYRVGISRIDEQHRHLIDMLNQLFRQVGGSHADTDLWLTRLDRYADQHFALEERLMREYAIDLDHRRGHEQAHEHYRQRVRQFRQAVSQQGNHAAVQMMAFLSGWWRDHIQGTDRKLGEALREAGCD